MNAGTVAKSCMGYGMLQYHTSTEEQDAMVMNLATVPTKATIPVEPQRLKTQEQEYYLGTKEGITTHSTIYILWPRTYLPWTCDKIRNPQSKYCWTSSTVQYPMAILYALHGSVLVYLNIFYRTGPYRTVQYRTAPTILMIATNELTHAIEHSNTVLYCIRIE